MSQSSKYHVTSHNRKSNIHYVKLKLIHKVFLLTNSKNEASKLNDSAAFFIEIEVPEKASPVNLASSSQIFEEIIEDVPLTQQQFTPPKIQQPKVIEVPDEEEISSDIDFDLDIFQI